MRSTEEIQRKGPRRRSTEEARKKNQWFFYIWKIFICPILYAQWLPPFLLLIRALSITFVRFLLYYFFHFLAKCAMQADDAFCYFNVVFFAPPCSFCSPFCIIVRLMQRSSTNRSSTRWAVSTFVAQRRPKKNNTFQQQALHTASKDEEVLARRR